MSLGKPIGSKTARGGGARVGPGVVAAKGPIPPPIAHRPHFAVAPRRATGLRARRRRRVASLVVLVCAWVPGTTSWASVAGGATSRFHPVVVQQVVHAFVDGHGVIGPQTLSMRLPRPSTRGDLLVAAVDDGVFTSGMVHPHYLFTNWDLAVTTIGGETQNDGQGGYETGGLQASIYYLADNPGGIDDIRVATVPRGTETVLTVAVAELSGVPQGLTVDTTGASTSGPSASTYTQKSAVTTVGTTTGRPDLVVALFNNGGNSPHGERYVTAPGWTLIGEDASPNNLDQPILANFKVVTRTAVATESERYLGGYPIDNCAVIVAFR